jgi:hypothetical protein
VAAKSQKPKRRHHHVWQHYLKAWTENDSIWCRQDDRIFSTGTPSIAVEKDFYKLESFTRDDLKVIETLFAQGHPGAKRNHAQLVGQLMAPFRLADQLKNSPHWAKIEQSINDYASSVLENYHATIEASFIPLLQSALNGDLSFYHDERIMPFLNYLTTQYMRTKGIKERTIALCEADKSADLSRVWNVLIHMFAANIGAGLYLERRRRKLILLNNRTNVPFITGDQPAVNLKSNRPHPPESLSIYYPLSPRHALLLADVDEEPLVPADGLSPAQASMLNEKLYAASYSQVFAESQISLQSLSGSAPPSESARPTPSKA